MSNQNTNTELNIFGQAYTDTSLQNRILAALIDTVTESNGITPVDLIQRVKIGAALPDNVAKARCEFIYLAKEIGIPAAVAGRFIFLDRVTSNKALKKVKLNDDLIKLGELALANQFGYDLTSFGNYLLSDKRKQITSEINQNKVTHADVLNWKA